MVSNFLLKQIWPGGDDPISPAGYSIPMWCRGHSAKFCRSLNMPCKWYPPCLPRHSEGNRIVDKMQRMAPFILPSYILADLAICQCKAGTAGARGIPTGQLDLPVRIIDS